MPVTNGTGPTNFSVLVGAGKVYIAGGGTTLPTPVATTSMNTTIAADTNWRYAGDTTDGIEIAFDRDVTEIEVDQYKSPVSYIVNGVTVSVNTNLAAAHIDNLKLAWGYGAAPATNSTLGIGEQDDVFYVSVAVVGKAPRPSTATATQKAERVYYCKFATNLDASSHSLTKDGMTVFPVSFRVVPDTASVGSEYGSVTDRLYTPA